MIHKTVLIVSYGPVPTPEYQKIEGGGMRAWGLATGLHANGYDVTVGVNASFPQTISEHKGIRLATWTEDANFIEVINGFDIVIISYCMGGTSRFVADNLSDDVTLVLDAYVPIYIEVSARNSSDQYTELTNYESDMSIANHTLKRGDYFLCANNAQKHMYTGILASMGIINPVTYSDKRVITVPFGTDDAEKAANVNTNPYTELGIKKSDFTLLWFGALYPWFNFQPLIESVEELSKDSAFKFVLVGGKNPYNSHPDFVKQYDYVRGYFSKSNLLNKSVFFIDWVDYDKRTSWFAHSDAVISINQEGDENEYSWRTRVMDYVGNTLPMFTNGGDPLSNELLAKDAAIYIDTEKKSIVTALTAAISDRSFLASVRKNLKAIQSEYQWKKVVIPLIESIEKDPLPYAKFLELRDKLGLQKTVTSSSKIAKAKKYYHKAREKGLLRSAKLATKIGISVVSSKVKNKAPIKPRQKVVLLSHPIDNTGAPLVLLDVAHDFAKHYSTRDIHIVAPKIEKHLLEPLKEKRFRIHKMAMGLNDRLIQAQLNIHYDDVVLMNTVALYGNYRKYVLKMLESDQLKQAIWFIHEDNPALQFANTDDVGRVKQLIRSQKIKVVVPSSQTANEYNEFFETDLVTAVVLRVRLPETLTQPRDESDFDTIRFTISGSPWDGRKGQFLLLSALIYFEKNLRKDGKSYRPYTLQMLALGDDYISDQLISIGEAFFGKKFTWYSKKPFLEVMEITRKANITVCTSLNETFALFVAEGMALGHPIIRNKSAGWKEQLKPGENGYLFDSLDLVSLAEAIDTVLSRDTTTNHDLIKMSQASQNIAREFSKSDYYEQLIKHR